MKQTSIVVLFPSEFVKICLLWTNISSLNCSLAWFSIRQFFVSDFLLTTYPREHCIFRTCLRRYCIFSIISRTMLILVSVRGLCTLIATINLLFKRFTGLNLQSRINIQKCVSHMWCTKSMAEPNINFLFNKNHNQEAKSVV